jgi:hypothetical protein
MRRGIMVNKVLVMTMIILTSLIIKTKLEMKRVSRQSKAPDDYARLSDQIDLNDIKGVFIE